MEEKGFGVMKDEDIKFEDIEVLRTGHHVRKVVAHLEVVLYSPHSFVQSCTNDVRSGKKFPKLTKPTQDSEGWTKNKTIHQENMRSMTVAQKFRLQTKKRQFIQKIQSSQNLAKFGLQTFGSSRLEKVHKIWQSLVLKQDD
jgi:hypothetical protein